MRKFRLLAALSMAAVLVTGAVSPAVSVEAASNTVVDSSYIGGGTGYSSVTEVTVNGKNISKLPSNLKKKLRVAKTATHKRGVIKVSNAYKAGKAKKTYVKTYNWHVDYLSAGTYTFKSKKIMPKKEYEVESYAYSSKVKYTYTFTYFDDQYNVISTSNYTSYETLSYSEMSSVLDSSLAAVCADWDWDYDYEYEDLYRVYTVNPLTNERDQLAKYFLKKTDKNHRTYYISEDGKDIYAYSDDISAWVPAKLLATNELEYQPLNYTTVTTTEKVIVENSWVPTIKSVKLGNCEIASSEMNEDGAYTSTYVSKKHLSGSKGKLTVSTGKNTKLMDIIVKTYDKDGNEVYKLVKNKSTVTYGKYARQTSVTNSYSNSTYDSFNTDMFKDTEVYVFYKDKLNGGYTDIQKVWYDKKDACWKFKYKAKLSPDSKAVVETTSYLPSSYQASYSFYK